MSPLGISVANLLGEVFRGLHKSPVSKKTDWNHPHTIEVVCKSFGGMGTVDCDTLTRMVFLSHDFGIRAEMVPHTFSQTKWQFSQRTRGGSTLQDHPTLEEALEQHRTSYPKENEYNVQRKKKQAGS